MKVTVECSRCHTLVDGLMDDCTTGGFYNVKDGSGWELYADIGEEVLCDSCMHNDYRYRSVYHGEELADAPDLIKMVDDDYTVRFYKDNGLYCVDIVDGGYYSRHQEQVAEGRGSTLESAKLHAQLQYFRWYDKRTHSLRQ